MLVTPLQDTRRETTPGKRPINVLPPSKEITPPAQDREIKEASPTKSAGGTSTSSVIYIPDFLEKVLHLL